MYEIIGGKIKTARKAAGITQAQLADDIGVGISSIGRWERGELSITVNALAEIAEAVNVPLSYFFEPTPTEKWRRRTITAFECPVCHSLSAEQSYECPYCLVRLGEAEGKE